MVKAPIIFKIKFTLPQDKEAGGKNAAHARYIALRSGVVIDKEVTEKDLDNDLDMGFKETKEKSYESYIHERSGSHGLFGPDEKQPNLTQVQKELREHQGVVWRAIISLREDDANYLGYTDKEKWQQSIRSRMAEMAKEMGVSESNLKWVAAFHQAKGHPHVHLVFWEEKPQRSRGKLSDPERINIRKTLTTEFYREERDRLGKAKNQIRKYVLEKSKGDLDLALELTKELKQNKNEIVALEGNLKGVEPAPTLYSDQAQELARKINSLANIMPGTGRKSLAFMPAEVKAEAREIADWILNQPGFKLETKKYIETAEGFSRHYSKNDEQIKNTGDKAYEDLRDRVAQEVIRHTGSHSFRPAEKINNINMARGAWKGAWETIKREQARQEMENNISKRKLDRKPARATYEQKKSR